MEISSKYLPLWKNKTRYFVITGGRGSAKSFTVNLFLSQLLYQNGHKALFTRYTLTAASKSIIPEFLEKLQIQKSPLHDGLMVEDYAVTNNEIKNRYNDSSILFSGIKTSSGNQTANLKSLQGVSTWILDEAEELLDEDVFDKIDLSIREKSVQNRVIIILNPATKEHWIYKRFFEDNGIQAGYNGTKGDVTYIHTTYLDNKKNLSESYLERIYAIKENRPDRYQHQILGGWMNRAEGVVFSDWEIGEYNEDLAPIFGQDFGFSVDPTTLVKVGIDQKRMTIYLKELLYKKALTTSDIAEINLTHAGSNLVVADSAEPRLIEELKSKGVNIKPVKKGAGSIQEGITLMKDYHLVIDPSSTNLIKELNNYAWLDKGTKPIDAWNHCIDATRYAITHALANVNGGKYYVY